MGTFPGERGFYTEIPQEAMETSVAKEAEKEKPIGVVVVEDDLLVGKLICSTFELIQGEFETSLCQSAEQFEEMVEERKRGGLSTDLVCTDFHLLGEGTGLDVAAAAAIENAYVIMLTGRAKDLKHENTEEQLREKGIHCLMGKPFDVDEFERAVNNAVTTIKQSTQQPTEIQ